MTKLQSRKQAKQNQKEQRDAALAAPEKGDGISSSTITVNSCLAQVAWLGDSRVQSAQRQTLAAQIGQLQGNKHLQKIVTPQTPAEITNVLQLSLDEFDRRRQRVNIAVGHPIRPFPTNPEERQEGALYYDESDPDLEAMCCREAVAQRSEIYGRIFIIGYPRYRIYFRFGRGAISRRGNRVAVPDQELLAMYRHERVHQQQYQALRRVDYEIARQNREHHEAIGRFTPQEEIDRHLAAMVPIDPEILSRRTESEHLTTVRAEAMEREVGVDLTNHANREVQAHIEAFAQMVPSYHAAIQQLRPLCAVCPQVGTTPRWSYDMADAHVRRWAVQRVLAAVWTTPQAVSMLNNQIVPDLEEVEDNERSHNRTPTAFVEDIRSDCQPDAQGRLVPDPETVLEETTLRRESGNE